MDDLFSPDDPDLIAYQEGSQEYYLRVASATIRKYLGWHLAPSIRDIKEVEAGAKGITMLPSRYVTNIYSIRIVHSDDTVPVDDGAYWWDAEGYVQFSGFGPPIGQRLRVDFQHGYDEVPLDVKAVAYELVAANSSGGSGGGVGGASGPVSGMVSPGGYRVNFSSPSSSDVPFAGFNMNPDQMQRLSGYKLSEVK